MRSRVPTSSLPGLTPQVGLARLAALNNAELGQARVPVQSILLRKKMDARVTPPLPVGRLRRARNTRCP
ncbi:MAG: hypothetical protein E6G77_25395 [Alphaproteobacteria bacterium]|nr:MAG: hypothetical protein E6G77_25395 [Alphaproteobacteria bacterium]